MAAKVLLHHPSTPNAGMSGKGKLKLADVSKRIKNKIKRGEVVSRLKSEKGKEKLQRRMEIRKNEEKNPELRKERLETNVPKTIDSMREVDETIVLQDEEVLEDEEQDEFKGYFKEGITPKLLVTTTRHCSGALQTFTEEFTDIFPNSTFVKRGTQFSVKRIIELAIKREYTDLLIVGEEKRKPSTLTVIHLPDGPTAHFKLSSAKLCKEISGHGRATAHQPELILNNFSTRLGHTIGRMFASLFPQLPEFQGRQAATFHNQRDFIFFRRHRYIFKDGKRANLQELGPRFTLKLLWLQKGTFDTKLGEYEWMHRPEMDTSRRRFFL